MTTPIPTPAGSERESRNILNPPEQYRLTGGPLGTPSAKSAIAAPTDFELAQAAAPAAPLSRVSTLGPIKTGQLDKVVEDSKGWAGTGETLLHIDTEKAKHKKYSEAYVDGFRQFKYLAGVLLRFPFEYRRLENGHFEFFWHYLQGLGFLITSIAFATVTVLYTYNIISVILNFPQMNAETGIGGGDRYNARAEEMYVFYRNSAMAVMFGMLLLHVCVANWSTFRKRTLIAHYFTYSAFTLDKIQVPAADGLSRFLFFLNIGFVAFILLLIGMMVLRVSPIVSGGPGFIGILMIRGFYPQVYQDEGLYKTLRIYSQGLMIYLLLAAKVYVILFIFQCKVVEGAFHLWNQRLELVLNRGDNFLVLEDRLGGRTSFREMFDDHESLLDLIDGADTLFADTIESYYVAQMLSMTFEMYWFWRSLAGDEFQDSRKLDVIFILIYLLHSFVFMLLASFAAANVAEEAMDGLEVLRRKGMFGRKSPEELYFLMSLYVSYTGHYDIAISAGGYSNIDRSFLVAVCGTILSYFIVLIQFSHPLALDPDDPLRQLIKEEAKLIRQVEDTIIWFSRYDFEAVEL